jgi:hypothetical protein
VAAAAGYTEAAAVAEERGKIPDGGGSGSRPPGGEEGSGSPWHPWEEETAQREETAQLE